MRSSPPIIDAHQHFWELGRFDTRWLEAPGKTAICRNFLPADLRPLLDEAGVAYTVFVQTQHLLEENRWALQLAAENPWIRGVVGWIDLASPTCEAQLDEFLENPVFVGVRHITQDEPDDNFIIRPEIRRGLAVLERRGVPFDLLFYVKHLHHAAPLAREFPNLKLVIDHLAKPVIREQQFAGWEQHFRAAAMCPNVYCKLSGMITEADWEHWQPADLQRYVEVAVEAFGPQRLMYGSDWPVCELAGSYQRVIDALRECLADLSASEQEQIFCRTAAEFYGLSLPAIA
jgi:L-fuconolactonase